MRSCRNITQHGGIWENVKLVFPQLFGIRDGKPHALCAAFSNVLDSVFLRNAPREGKEPNPFCPHCSYLVTIKSLISKLSSNATSSRKLFLISLFNFLPQLVLITSSCESPLDTQLHVIASFLCPACTIVIFEHIDLKKLLFYAGNSKGLTLILTAKQRGVFHYTHFTEKRAEMQRRWSFPWS